MTENMTETVRLVSNRSDTFLHSLRVGPSLRLAAADVLCRMLPLYAYDPGTKATAHRIDLSGELHEIWLVLQTIEWVLSQHACLNEPPQDQRDEQRTVLYEEALVCIRIATRYLQYLDIHKLQIALNDPNGTYKPPSPLDDFITPGNR